MKGYLKPCIRENDPGHLIFHVGTKYVLSGKTKKICRVIRVFDKGNKEEQTYVSVSSCSPCNGNWNSKLMEVNSYLKDLYESNIIPFMNNRFINPKKHLNSYRLHLNPKGSKKFRDNFVKFLKVLSSSETVKRN